MTSLASWSVINASNGMAVGTGLLPGLKQSINRAELWAVYVAFLWALEHGVTLWIYSDSSYVVNGVQRLQREGIVPHGWDNIDLWTKVLHSLQCFGSSPQIFKTRAHRCESEASTEQEAWEIHWNSMADVNAKAALRSAGSPMLRHIWEQLHREHDRNVAYATRFQKFLLALVLWSLPEPCQVNLRILILCRCLRSTTLLIWEAGLTLFQCIGGLLWPIMLSSSLWDSPWLKPWLSGSLNSMSRRTLFLLLMGFRLMTGLVLPIQMASGSRIHWLDPNVVRVGELATRTLAHQVKTMKTLLISTFEALCYDGEWSLASKPELGIFKQVETLLIPWPCTVARRVQFELHAFCARRPIRMACDLARQWR